MTYRHFSRKVKDQRSVICQVPYQIIRVNDNSVVRIAIQEYYRFNGWMIFSEPWMGTDEYVAWAVPETEARKPTTEDHSNYNEWRFPYEVITPDETICRLAQVNTKSRESMCRLVEDQIRDWPLPKKKTPKKKPQNSVRRTSKDKEWAILVKHRDGKCRDCGNTRNLHAHHIKAYRHHPELRHDLNNGITLCGVCHRKHHAINGR